MNINQLPSEQLQGLKQQLDNDVTTLAAAYDELATGRTRYLDNCTAIESYKQFCKAASSTQLTADGASSGGKEEMLVPMTSSLFVKGQLVPHEKVIIDVGTGYFLQQPMDRAVDYFNARASEVKDRLELIEKSLNVKRVQRNHVIDTLQRRRAEYQEQQQQQQQKQE